MKKDLLIQFFKFGIVGTLGFLVDSGVLMLNTKLLGLDLYSGRVVSFLFAVTTTWFCNRHFTFRGQGGASLHKEWARFFLVSLGGFTFNYGTYAALITFLPLVTTFPILGVAAGSLAGMFFNFFAARRVVFR